MRRVHILGGLYRQKQTSLWSRACILSVRRCVKHALCKADLSCKERSTVLCILDIFAGFEGVELEVFG